MAGRVKHMKRSHKTINKHYNEYQRKASVVESRKYEMSLFDRLRSRFKHQDR
ncbi:hypothetical protein I5677_12310 [Mobilitalea sibirica]|uniref:Uncharacterized protein n=1 Tax=Mobilitalea sibirica TaxID=1462919 RepID=A0A8J7HD59_9FIRM|nr:hypothetical protein [Mobilitalea sibirica]MBH1941677.1 hypothetical protein [Mobilitalea sibirica]